jgi:hypothetical protein
MKRLILAALLAGLCAGAAAQVTMTGAGLGASAGGGGGQSAWNPSDANAAITLSTTNFTNDTATQNSAGSSFRSVRGTKSYATGTANKKIFALFPSSVDTANGWLGGLDNGAGSLTSYVGSGVHSYGVENNSAGDYQDGGGATTGSGTCTGLNLAQGQFLYLAINFNNGHLFCSKDCITWANSGSPDGDTGFVATLSSATYLPMWTGFDNGGFQADAAIINTLTSLGGCTNVSTFSGWG